MSLIIASHQNRPVDESPPLILLISICDGFPSNDMITHFASRTNFYWRNERYFLCVNNFETGLGHQVVSSLLGEKSGGYCTIHKSRENTTGTFAIRIINVGSRFMIIGSINDQE